MSGSDRDDELAGILEDGIVSDDEVDGLADLLNEVREEEKVPPKKEKPKKVEKPKGPVVKTDGKELPNLNLRQGLKFGRKVDPPEGYTSAYMLEGNLGFVGGRKHDRANGLVAVALDKMDVWHYVGHSSLPNVVSSPKIEEWLEELK